MEGSGITVGVVFNHVDDDYCESLRNVDPASLPFTPEYRIDVATVEEEYQAIATGLEKAGFAPRLVNVSDDLRVLLDTLWKDPPDVVFNLVEHLHGESILESSVAGVYELLGIPFALPILEYDFSELPEEHPRVLSYDVKWDPMKEEYHKVHTICPAPLSKSLTKKVHEAAIRAFALTGCRDYARVDIRLSKDKRVYVLEVNPNPDLTEGVSFMECAERHGLTFTATLRRIVEGALTRGARRAA